MKKFKLFCKVCQQSKALSDVYNCCGLVLSIPLFIILFIILPIFIFALVSYVMGKYTPFYTVIYKSNDIIEICDPDNIEGVRICIARGMASTLALALYIFLIAVFITEKCLNKKSLFIFNIIYIPIYLFLYNVSTIGYLLSDYKFLYIDPRNCYYNTTINNYTQDCRIITFDVFMWIIGIVSVSTIIILIIALVYPPCKKFYYTVKEDLNTFDVQSVKIES